MYLEDVHPVAIISDPYLRSFPELVVNVCFSISMFSTGSSYNVCKEKPTARN